jgi:hypothetical protein
MLHSNDSKNVRLQPIHQRIRKPVEVDPSRASGTRRPEVRELGYQFEGPLEIHNEVLTQAGCLGFIVFDSR